MIRHLTSLVLPALCLAACLGLNPAPMHGGGGSSSPAAPFLRRIYHDGDRLVYRFRATNKDRRKTVRYSAQAACTVKRDTAGRYTESIAWSELTVNESRMPAGAAEFRQICSLDTSSRIVFPDISKVNPFLVGPISDLLIFYADFQLAARSYELNAPGTRTHVENSKPNSWADGRRIRVGEDQLEFDLSLGEIDPADSTITLSVRHSPPSWSNVNMPAHWMYHPIDSTPNNWVQVTRDEKGVYVGSIGSESYTVVMKIDLRTGAILNGTLENIIDILQRDCADSLLTNCGDTVRYTVRRQSEMQHIP